jgi:hypothetical protein
MALTKDPLFWKLGIVFGVILLGGLGYSVMSANSNANAASTANTGPYVDVKEETRYNTEANKNVGGSRKSKKKKKSLRKSKKH